MSDTELLAVVALLNDEASIRSAIIARSPFFEVPAPDARLREAIRQELEARGVIPL